MDLVDVDPSPTVHEEESRLLHLTLDAKGHSEHSTHRVGISNDRRGVVGQLGAVRVGSVVEDEFTLAILK